VQPPTKLRHVIPDYPELARRAGVQGVVVLDCLLDTGGNVSEVSVVSGHPLLKGAALDAVRSWRYTPTRLNGAPVPVLLTVTVEFRLRR
jgi:protein TonB